MMSRAELLGRLQDRGVRFSGEEELVYWDDKSVLIRHSRFGEERARVGATQRSSPPAPNSSTA